MNASDNVSAPTNGVVGTSRVGSEHARRARRRTPLLSPLIVLAVLLSPMSAPAPVALSMSYGPWCPPTTYIPDEAYAVERFARTHNFTPPPGLKGGRSYTDDTHALPARLRPYKEYDVYPASPTKGRGAERVVLSDRLDHLSWYTPDHYEHFMLMYPVGCVAGRKSPARTPLPKPPARTPLPQPPHP